MTRISPLLVAIAFVGSAAAGIDDGRTHIARWVHEDAQGISAISLNAAGECSIYRRHKTTGMTYETECTYWIHGSRVNFRDRRKSAWRGDIPIQAEYIPQEDVLILDGDEARPLKRRPASFRIQ